MSTQPLSYRMRPKTIDEILGQSHLVGENSIIRRMVKARRLSSMILYGPPGIGKTSIASAIAGSTNYKFRTLNAVTNTKKDMQAVAEEGKMSGSVILLLDEIHRLDKAKQDFLLPHLENGNIILIGATTSNPYHAINPAIRSRCQIFELELLDPDDVREALERAIGDASRGLGDINLEISDEAIGYLSHTSQGDVRSALNALELAALSTEKNSEGVTVIGIEDAKACMQKSDLLYDKDGDQHYDVMSAFQKSIRGSDVDAALHYLARLVEAGDLVTIARRLLVISYEDIGLANPQLASRTLDAIVSAERLGFPEARIPLSQAVIELSLSPKSNSAIKSIDGALSDIRKKKTGAIPKHLKDSHYKSAEKLGNGIGYKYPHNYPNHVVSQQYLPDPLKNAAYYQTSDVSKYEKQLADIYDKLKKL
ncbi:MULTISPECIES: replication-associated recombination protein A [Salinicoccus]|uniref:Replication-associated recombination protein A n=1 Tax=Salinicoccus roseus TaxID=45670 RepID=A0A265E9F9_9STAP|nr:MULTISPECIES: replication-associated recombination protein A [Salinicoccus]MCC4721927.1 replication-associated recombination protein A [Salinicoccus sp. RF5]OZT78229.1 recombinase RarA [Salinicoccus roseus]RPE54312.1 recombination protein MgsA [Salinicoccus roseus]GGA66469.1 recombination factor protein RarA [Salinicoccus roseus]